jgi:hypothetical protein
MACLPKLQHRHGWFCHLIGTRAANYIHQVKTSDQMDKRLFFNPR